MKTLPFVHEATSNSCRDEGRGTSDHAHDVAPTVSTALAAAPVQVPLGTKAWAASCPERSGALSEPPSSRISQWVFTFSGEGTRVLVVSLL